MLVWCGAARLRGSAPGPRFGSGAPTLGLTGGVRPGLRHSEFRLLAAASRFLRDIGVTRFVTGILGHAVGDGHSVVTGQPAASRRVAAREGTRSAEGLGGPRPSSLGLALPIRIW